MASLAGNANVVPVYRFGRLPHEAPYMVMRFVKGRTLRELIDGEGRLELDRGLEALAGVARALEEAHEKGIVHRDVRPGNVLWDEESDSALLTDFGIAAVLASGERQATRLTAVGELLGDTRYLSPEQLLDQEITEMVDVYAFGLLTTFQGVMFDGSTRMMELADMRNEIQVEARCWGGARATHNARLVNGVQVYTGALKVVGDTAIDEPQEAPEVTYELMCRKHWHAGLRAAQGDQLELLPDEAASPTEQPVAVV